MTDRRAFLKLSFQSFVDTVKEVAYPLLESQSEKIEAITQRLEGKVWAEVASLRDEERLAQRMVGRHLLFLARKGADEIEAIDGSCPTCGSPLSIRMMDQSLLCLPCNQVEQPAKTVKSAYVFTRLPIKQEGEKWLVEVRKPNA